MRKTMKNRIQSLFTATSLALMALVSTEPILAANQSYPVQICGTIQRTTSDDGAISDQDVRILTLDTEGELRFNIILEASSPDVQSILKSIVWPNHAYLGCVHGYSLPMMGIEGPVFFVEKIELKGQTSGVSVGN